LCIFSFDDQELCFVNFLTYFQFYGFLAVESIRRFVLKPLHLMQVSCRFSTSIFRSRSLLSAWSLVVILSASLTCAFAQTQPLDSPQRNASVAGQGSSSESPQAQAGSAATQSRGPIHIVPFGRGNAGVKNGAAPSGAHLTYFGGPVISNIHVVAVFWGPTVNSAITGGIGQFFTDITSSNYYDLLSEYSTVGITSSGGASSNQSLVRGQFDGAITITPSIACAGGTCTITDAQIQTELAAQITAGHLPQPLTDLQGIITTFYMIYFPPGVTIDAGGGQLSCVVFCAYHSNTDNASASLRMPYGVLPDFAAPSACSRGCGLGSLFQNVTAVTSHEMSEAATDAQVGSAPVNNGPPLAWYDPSPPPTPDLGEIGDICNGQDTFVSASGNTYSVQQEFSNLQNDCVSAPPIFSLAAPPTAGIGLPVSLRLIIESSVTNIALVGYLGTVHFTSSDGLAELPADYTFTAADAGIHSFQVTLNTLGSQTISITDTHSAGFNRTTTLNVLAAVPDLSLVMFHGNNFIQGQPGTYFIIVNNLGTVATSGAVTVVDTLPAGLTASAMSGPGWSCTVSASPSCTRSDVLNGSSASSIISLTVDVAANATSPVTNTATVSGGGEMNTANNNASDPTVIVPAQGDLTTAFATAFPPLFQGQINLSYQVKAVNSGNISSSGVVTVVNTLSAGLTATAISGSGWNCTLGTLTCTRADSLPTNSTFPLITITFNIAGNAPGSAQLSATVSGGGDANSANNTSILPLTITSPIQIQPTGGAVGVNAGDPAVFGLTISGQAFVGAISLSCSGLPAASSCSFNPPLAGPGTIADTLTITTTARSAVVGGIDPQRNRLPFLLAVVLLLTVLLGFGQRRVGRRRSLRSAFGMAGLLACALAIAGCGGGSNPPPTTGQGTQAGSYQITVTGASPTNTASSVVTLTVR
jgi:uncharacterized repeat protein (TIGR01451 family)